MKKHFTKLIVALLALAMLLPIVVQAAPTDGWTDEAEQAYQTLTEKAIQQVTESRDYLSLPIQQRNTRAVYALWTAGAVVPEGFYDAYLQSLSWLTLRRSMRRSGQEAAEGSLSSPITSLQRSPFCWRKSSMRIISPSTSRRESPC